MLEEIACNEAADLFEENLDHDDYDPEARLVAEPFHRHGPGSEGFNDLAKGTLVHPTRGSLGYAVALLDSGDESYYNRAFSTIETVIDWQSTDRDADYCGCWPWYVEVPLDEMVEVDYNWAAFLGRDLVLLLADHSERLPEDLRGRVRESLERAADLLVRRDMGPDYTNISLMSTFVAVKGGELLGDEELLRYGREKLREAVGYTRYHDDVTEYISPTYTRVSLYEVGRMLVHFDSERDRSLARVLNDRIWRSLSAHYHPETGQLAGPHIRTYDAFDSKTIGTIIGIGTDGRYGIRDLDEMSGGTGIPKVRIECPPKYFGNFETADRPTFRRNLFFRGNREYLNGSTSVPFSQFSTPVEARTYATDSYTLGSFTRMDCWTQRRPLLGYWGSRAKRYRFRMRCLSDRHGGYDFSSAVSTVSQYNNYAIGAVSFLTDTRALDETGSIEMGRLAVRFDVTSDVETDDVTLEERGSVHRFDGGGTTVDVEVLHVAFDGRDSFVTTGRGTDSNWIESRTWVDAVLFEGKRTTVDFTDVDRATVVYSVSVAPGTDEVESAYTVDDGEVDAELVPLELPGSVSVPISPCPPEEYYDRSAVDGAFSGRDVDEYGTF